MTFPVEFPEVTAENPKERRREADRLLRSALLVLMQHNYVSAHLVSPAPTVRNATPMSYHVYIADLPRILQALRCAGWVQRFVLILGFWTQV